MSDTVLGLLRAAGLDLALPLAALREVVPCPEHLDEVPASAPGLLGVMTLRGTVLPVVDLALVLGRPHERGAGQVVVVVASGGSLLGVLVDEVRGMATLDEDAFDEVAASQPLLFRRTFTDPSSGGVVALLEPPALLALPGVPVVAERTARSRAGVAASTGRGRTRPLTLVRCGAFVLALDVVHVHATVPAPALHPSPADGPVCLGVTPVQGFDVAVADLLALLGLGEQAGSPLDCGLVLDLPDGQVVLGVGAMIGLQDVPEERVVPLPPEASPSPELLRSVVDVDGVGACLLVDTPRLKTDPGVVALSRVATASDASSDAAADVARAVSSGPAYLSYDAGTTAVTALSQVVEVLGWPGEDLLRSSGAPHVLGLVLHRGTAVPVVDLAQVLGRTAPPFSAASRLLLVEVDGAATAFAVSALHAIAARTWADPASGRSGHPDVLRAAPLVQLAGADGLLPDLDLQALVRRLRGTPEVPAPRAAEQLLV